MVEEFMCPEKGKEGTKGVSEGGRDRIASKARYRDLKRGDNQILFLVRMI